MRRFTVFGIVLILSISTPFVFGKKVATLDELVNPFFIEADENRLYITDGPTINIYSLKDYSFVKRFGKEGPRLQEFEVNRRRSGGSVFIALHDDYILVNSIRKVSYFTKDGKYIKERKVRIPARRFVPLGDGFVGESMMADKEEKLYVARNIYDADFRKTKVLYHRRAFIQGEEYVNPFHAINPQPQVYRNTIFVNGDNEIHVFDSKGNELRTITWPNGTSKVTEDYKKGILNWYNTYPGMKRLYERIKNRLQYPEYFPKVRLYNVADQKIYVLTYKKTGDKSEFVILDLNGKLLKKTMLPFYNKDEFVWYPYTIRNNKLFQLIKNNEKWELHVTEIK